MPVLSRTVINPNTRLYDPGFFDIVKSVPWRAIYIAGRGNSTPADGQQMPLWRDLSGGEMTAFAYAGTTGTYRASSAAYNYRPVLECNQSSWLSNGLSFGPPYTLIAVANYTSTPTGVVASGGNNNGSIQHVSRTWGLLGTGSRLPVGTLPHLLIAQFGIGSTSSLEVDGITVISGLNVGSTVSSYWIGGTQFLAGFFYGNIALCGWTFGWLTSGVLESIRQWVSSYYGIPMRRE